MKHVATLLAAALIGLAAASPAAAHAHLEKAEPAVGATVSPGPTQVRLTFSEPVEPRFSQVVLAQADGTAVPAGAAAGDPADARVLVLKLGQALPAGSYKVKWKAVSTDTHRTEGSFGFRVGK